MCSNAWQRLAGLTPEAEIYTRRRVAQHSGRSSTSHRPEVVDARRTGHVTWRKWSVRATVRSRMMVVSSCNNRPTALSSRSVRLVLACIWTADKQDPRSAGHSDLSSATSAVWRLRLIRRCASAQSVCMSLRTS